MFSGFRWSSDVYLSPWLLRTSMRAMFCRIRWQPINPWTKMQSRYVTFFFPSFSCVHFKCPFQMSTFPIVFLYSKSEQKCSVPYTLCCKALLSKQRKKVSYILHSVQESSKKSPLKFRAKLRHFPRIFKHCDFGCIQSSSLFFLRIFSCLDVSGTNQSNWNKMYF